ncbi:short-chain fatty acyl-CoA regulator family protein [Hoeflea sp. TYP-13]|uniref:helix-turn-helix domain-containing protein n=1 Tax=Hoeflea sp. TYP-13 TaxID=3230023 RepID=UPI0034C6905C
MRARKLFIGLNIRRIRQETGLTQADFAKQLGISTSYLNQIENNQRHVTAPVLLALAENFSVDIASLSENDSDRLLADMAEAIADPLFKGQQPSAQDLKLVTQNTPTVARAFLAMHQALRRAGEQLAELDDTLERSGGLNEPTPYEEVRDFFHYLDNYVHELDIAAEQLAGGLKGATRNRVRTLADHLERNHRVRVAIGGAATEADAIRRYDPVARVLSVNPKATPSTHAFQLAHQIGLLEHADTMTAIIDKANFHSQDAAAVCRIGLANYFAGSALLPYGEFLAAAGEVRHDLELLADRFGASIEQVAHRLSTLQRPGNKGIPFFFARVDQAGNITKRHSATKLQFARFGSACPLWNVHNAFATSSRILRQLAETPDGVRYLCLATAVTKPSGGFRDPVQRYALAFGCEIKHAGALIYADDLDLASDTAFEPIGISCRICERSDCHQRAVPPLKRKLSVDPNSRDTIPYSFD